MKKTVIFLTLILVGFVSSIGQAQSKFNISERAKKREGSRWTLAEWLAQKDRNKLMDQWLWLNSPDPYEFSFSGANTNYKKKIGTSETEHTITSLDASAYAHIFGLTLEYDKRDGESENDLTGLFNLRLLGSSIQSSALTVHYGQRTRTFSGLNPISVTRNQFYQVSLQIYLGRYFGINGHHRTYLPFTDTYFGEITGTQIQAGAFLEFEFLRIFGTYFKDTQTNTTQPETQREGLKTGLQFFF